MSVIQSNQDRRGRTPYSVRLAPDETYVKLDKDGQIHITDYFPYSGIACYGTINTQDGSKIHYAIYKKRNFLSKEQTVLLK